MSSILYPSSFATSPTLTLHNGTTHSAAALITLSAAAQIDYVVLPNKVIYDPNGTIQAPRLPEAVLARVVVRLASKAAIVTEFEAMCGHVGKRATLTANKVSSGTMTCTARLERVENVYPFQEAINTMIWVQLRFQPLTIWA